MNYGYSNSPSWGEIIIPLLICIAILIGFTLICNACTAEDWNDGICPHCSVKYELRGATKYFKYYACPKCGQEVERM